MPSLVQTITTSTGVGAVPAFTLIAPLPELGFETRHMQAVLTAQINKTDRNDARGIAQMMRAGLYRPVHVKTYAVRNCGCC